MPSEDAARLVFEAIEAAVNGDTDTAAHNIARLGADSDGARMYGVCCAIAAPGKQALEKLFGDKAPDLSRGDYWAVINLRPLLHRMRKPDGDIHAQEFAVQFLVAYCNGDADNERALYAVVWKKGGEHFTRCVSQLFADVAGLCSAAIKHVRAQG